MPGGNKNIKPEDGKQFQKGDKAAEIWTEKIALKLGNDLLDWMLAEDENIFFEEFIFIIADAKNYHERAKIYPELIPYLKNKFSSFLKLIEKAKKLQEVKLNKFGCFDKLNASMTKFMLINHHNYKDRSEIDHSSKDGSMSTKINVTVLDRETAENLKKLNEND